MPLPTGLDVAATFGRFSRSGDDLLDRWDGEVLTRCARVDGRVVPFAARVSESALEVSAAPAHVAGAVRAARSMVEPLPTGWTGLLDADPALRQVAARHPGLYAVRTLDPVVALVMSISAQQVNLRWAATTRRRLAEAYGDPVAVGTSTVHVLDFMRLARASVEDLRALQVTTAKARSLIGLAAAVDDGALDVGALAGLDDETVVSTLVGLRGIGPWTAQWYLARVLGRPVVVAGDLAVRKAVGLLYGTAVAPSPAETLALTAHWAACALTAQQLVLHALGAATLP